MLSNRQLATMSRRMIPKLVHSQNYRLRVDLAPITAIIRPIALSNEAVAAGMGQQDSIYEIMVPGNQANDKGIAFFMDANKNFELSLDGGANYQALEILGPIRNPGHQWEFRVKL